MKVLNLGSTTTTLNSLLIVALVFIITMAIGVLYLHNNDDNGLEIDNVFGALPQKPPFGAGMAYSTGISIQIHGVDLKLNELTIPKIFSSENFGKKSGSSPAPVGGAIDIDNFKKSGSSPAPLSPPSMPSVPPPKIR